MTKSRSTKSRSAKSRSTKSRSAKSRSAKRRPGKHSSRRLVPLALAAAVVLAVIGFSLVPDAADPPMLDTQVIAGPMQFTDVRAQAREFITYNRRIKLTAAQEAVKREALWELRAACCNDYSAYTCCCECNLSKTIWGLANHLIVEKGYGAEQVLATVVEWRQFVGPEGFSGTACFSGGCSRTFDNDGCGGMSESALAT